MNIGNWLTLIAILVALFGERLWRFFDTEKKKKEARVIIKQSLELLKSNLLRIRDVRNVGKTNDGDSIIFNSTSFSEINGYYFLFSDLLLPNNEQLELSKYPATIEFFNHYKINIETIRAREEDRAGTGVLTLGTVNNLISRLEKSIGEFNSQLEMNMFAKKEKKIIAREGLIVLGFIGLIILLMFIPAIYIFIDNLIEKYIKHGDIIWETKPLLENTINNLIPLVIFCYPLYWAIRFTIWAVRMLRDGQ